jgi:hypothetical protein
LMAVVVLPHPPFWFTTAIVRMRHPCAESGRAEQTDRRGPAT